MLEASVVVDPEFVVGPVGRGLFGGFVEHVGRCVYGGLVEAGPGLAGGLGVRADVVELVRGLGISSVRYPGGNFVSGYRWEDGVGPVGSRPARLDLAWHCTEPNWFGLGEFMGWVRRVGAEPMVAVNLGTRGVQEAVDLLEYCNVSGGSLFSDLRRSHGAVEPFGVRMWCLGNEMDGPWQVGHKGAGEYGRLAAETARAMRRVDPGLTLVACGSSGPDMDSFGAWEAEVLQEAYEEVDLVSAHAYFWERDGDLGSFLASAVKLEAFLDDVVATVDHVRARRRAGKRVGVSVDEWNVWYLDGEASRPPVSQWPVGPRLLEDRYHVADAVVVGSLLIGLLRHADRVASASLAQLVNVIAPIMTEPGGPAWKQTTYHPFACTSAYARGQVLLTPVRSDLVSTADYGDVPALHAVATHDVETGQLNVFAVNRSTDQPLRLRLTLRALPGSRLICATTLHDTDPYRSTGPDDTDPPALTPNPHTHDNPHEDHIDVLLPPTSWNHIHITTGSAA